MPAGQGARSMPTGAGALSALCRRPRTSSPAPAAGTAGKPHAGFRGIRWMEPNAASTLRSTPGGITRSPAPPAVDYQQSPDIRTNEPISKSSGSSLLRGRRLALFYRVPIPSARGAYYPPTRRLSPSYVPHALPAVLAVRASSFLLSPCPCSLRRCLHAGTRVSPLRMRRWQLQRRR
jgi:hypothetical protein